MNYESIYTTFVSHYRTNPFIGHLSHRHHIIPQSLGGTDTEDNVVYVRPHEHYFLHRCLFRFISCYQTAHAIQVMAHKLLPKDKIRSSRIYKLEMKKIELLFGRPIIQFSMFGDPIKVWRSIAEASRHVNGDISTACRNGNASAGFQWIYLDKFAKYRIDLCDTEGNFRTDVAGIPQINAIINPRWSNILEYDESGKLVHVFENVNSLPVPHRGWWTKMRKNSIIWAWETNRHFYCIRKTKDIKYDIEIPDRYKTNKVSMFNEDGKLICHFPSIKSAERATGIPHYGISQCCNGSRYTTHKRMFRYGYVSHNIEPHVVSRTHNDMPQPNVKKIAAYDLDGKFLRFFSSKREFISEFGDTGKRISTHIAKGVKLHGMQLKYATEENYTHSIAPYVDHIIEAVHIDSGETFYFSNPNVAERFYLFNASAIRRTIAGQQDHHLGFKFRKVDIVGYCSKLNKFEPTVKLPDKAKFGPAGYKR